MALQFHQRLAHDHPDGTQRMILRDLLLRGEVTEQHRGFFQGPTCRGEAAMIDGLDVVEVI